MITVVIPCIPKHFLMIKSLLRRLGEQSKIPEEVIISLSEYEKIDTNFLSEVENTNYLFKLLIIKHKEKKTPGENRQYGSEKASNDHIIYQDADDIPHPQRLEILEHIFNKYDANHITHLLTRTSRGLQNIHNVKNITAHKWKVRSSIKGSATSAGNIGINKRVLEKVSWTNHKLGEDTRFTDKVLSEYDNCYRLGIILLLYRTQFSSDHK